MDKLSKVLVTLALIGIGAYIYSQYKKAKKTKDSKVVVNK